MSRNGSGSGNESIRGSDPKKQMRTLAQWRELRGFTQQKLAEMAGLSVSIISAIESAGVMPKVGTAQAIVHALSTAEYRVLVDDVDWPKPGESVRGKRSRKRGPSARSRRRRTLPPAAPRGDDDNNNDGNDGEASATIAIDIADGMRIAEFADLSSSKTLARIA